jgi:hypothetical protein
MLTFDYITASRGVSAPQFERFQRCFTQPQHRGKITCKPASAAIVGAMTYSKPHRHLSEKPSKACRPSALRSTISSICTAISHAPILNAITAYSLGPVELHRATRIACEAVQPMLLARTSRRTALAIFSCGQAQKRRVVAEYAS